MKFSINGPLSGSLPVVLVVEKYIKLLKTIKFIEPSNSLSSLYKFGTGFSEPTETEGGNLTLSTLKNFYKSRIRGNTQAYIRVLCEYLAARLKMLDEIPQGRQSLDLDTSKAIKYYYNLSRHASKEILLLAQKKRRGHPIDRQDLNRLMSRISLESMMTFSQMGMISPNPRCDDSLKILIEELTPTLIKVASESPRESSVFAELLQMYANITRLYYGAVNTRDRDPQLSDNNPISLVTDNGNGPLRIGNDVVACLPAPTLDLLYQFNDPQAQVISPEALDYVSFLDNSYLRRL